MERMPKVKKVMITLKMEQDDGTIIETHYEYEKIHISQRCGLKKHVNISTGHVDNISTNGHEVLVLTAWKGCEEPNLFIANEEIHYFSNARQPQNDMD